MLLTFESVDKILPCYHQMKHGAISLSAPVYKMKLRIFAQFGLDLLLEYKRNPLCGSTSIQILIKATFSICLRTLVRGVGCCRIMCEVLILILYRYCITQHYFNLFFVCSGPSWDMKSLRHNVGQEK